MMQKKELLLILSIGLTVLFCDCSNRKSSCPTSEIDTYLVSEQIKVKVPYRKDGLDTLVFLSDDGDSAILLGQGSKTYINREIWELPSPSCEQGTGGIYHDYEVLYFPFAGSNPKLNFIIANYLGYGTIQMAFSNQILTTLDLTKYPTATSPIDSFLYQDTIHIDNQVFNGRVSLVLSNPESANPTFLIFYNNQYGILRIKKDGRTWNKKF